MSLLVRVYASGAKMDCYLYVLQAQGLEAVPEALHQQLAPLRQALEMELTAETQLARASAEVVARQLQTQGFYLQLPPPIETGR